MTTTRALTPAERIHNYAYQDECIHNFVLSNCPTYMTAKQKRRANKKMRKMYKQPFRHDAF